MMPGMPERRTHDYAHSGVMTLFAALDVSSGQIIGSLHRRHRAVEFKKFLAKIDANVPAAPRTGGSAAAQTTVEPFGPEFKILCPHRGCSRRAPATS